MQTFRCERCGGVFKDTTTEAEVRAEFRALFPNATAADATAALCSRCYREFMAWFGTLSEFDKHMIDQTYRRHQRAQGIQ